MICAIDFETRGLNATKPIIGCLWIEGRKKHESYRTGKAMWKRVLQLARAEAKRGKTLTIYSHNAQYDTATYVNLKDRHLKLFCNRPFIWKYRLKEKELKKLGIEYNGDKEIISFLDTMSLYPRMSLKAVGEITKQEKQEYDLKDIETKKIDKEELRRLEEYCSKDCMVVLKAIKKIKETLKKEGIQIRRLYTINQVGRNYLFNKWLRMNKKYLEPYFWNEKSGVARRTFRKEEIHAAYRGGRCEAWKTGKIKGVHYYDVNSLYPYSISKMRTPDLRTERKEYNDNKDWLDKWKTRLCFKIGIARCMIKNKSNEIGILQIRTEKDNFYPKPGQILIGTWTHDEILTAIQEGYELIDIQWCVTWKEAPNPFKEIMKTTYKRRIEAEDEYEKWFYKMMMNTGIGKLAQHKNNQIIEIDNIEETHKYLKKNYEIISHYGYLNFFRGQPIKKQDKPYYMPIIPTLCNAYARLYMYKFYKIAKTRVYTDTDSVICEEDIDKVIPIGNKLGEFKKVETKKEINIMGRKTYRIGDSIKIAGIQKRGIKNEEFDKGQVTFKKQITISTTQDINKVGEFREEKRDLLEQLENHKKRQSSLKEERILVDFDIDNINFFMEKVVDVV